MTLDPAVIIKLHYFLHDFIAGAEMKNEVGGIKERFQIMRNSEGLKYIIYKNLILVEQNKNKKSAFGVLASKGHKITWSTPHMIKVINNTIYYQGKKVKLDEI